MLWKNTIKSKNHLNWPSSQKSAVPVSKSLVSGAQKQHPSSGVCSVVFAGHPLDTSWNSQNLLHCTTPVRVQRHTMHPLRHCAPTIFVFPSLSWQKLH